MEESGFHLQVTIVSHDDILGDGGMATFLIPLDDLIPHGDVTQWIRRNVLVGDGWSFVDIELVEVEV